MNVLRPPQVQVLAEKLSACLAQPDEVNYPISATGSLDKHYGNTQSFMVSGTKRSDISR